MRQNANDLQPSCLLAWPLITASAVTHGADWRGFLPCPSLLCSCEYSTLVARGISRTLVSGDVASLYLRYDSRDATFCNLCDLHQLGRIAGHILNAHCNTRCLTEGLARCVGIMFTYHMTATAAPLTCCSLSWYQVAELLWAWGQHSSRLLLHAAAVGFVKASGHERQPSCVAPCGKAGQTGKGAREPMIFQVADAASDMDAVLLLPFTSCCASRASQQAFHSVSSQARRANAPPYGVRRR